jgi:hypothetical protein
MKLKPIVLLICHFEQCDILQAQRPDKPGVYIFLLIELIKRSYFSKING